MRSGICLKRVEHKPEIFGTGPTVLSSPTVFGKGAASLDLDGVALSRSIDSHIKVVESSSGHLRVTKALQGLSVLVGHIKVGKDMRKFIKVSEDMGSHLCTESIKG